MRVLIERLKDEMEQVLWIVILEHYKQMLRIMEGMCYNIDVSYLKIFGLVIKKR